MTQPEGPDRLAVGPWTARPGPVSIVRRLSGLVHPFAGQKALEKADEFWLELVDGTTRRVQQAALCNDKIQVITIRPRRSDPIGASTPDNAAECRLVRVGHREFFFRLSCPHAQCVWDSNQLALITSHSNTNSSLILTLTLTHRVQVLGRTPEQHVAAWSFIEF